MQDAELIQRKSQETTRTTQFVGLLGLIIISFWCIWFLFRALYVGTWLVAFLLLISLGELLALTTHLFIDIYVHPGVHVFWQSTTIHFVLFLISTFTALTIFWDHRRLESTNKGHRQLMVYLKWFAEQNWTAVTEPLENTLKAILNGLVSALDERTGKERQNSPRLNATILISDLSSASREFEILVQDQSNTFPPETIIPNEHTVVSDVVRIGNERRNPRLLLYVPWTRFCHGVCFEYSVRVGTPAGPWEDLVTEMSIVPTSYKLISSSDNDRLGCLLCIPIHLDHGISILHKGRSIERPCAVLCLSSPRQDSLKSEAFDAARLISGLLPRVMQRMPQAVQLK